VKRALVLLSLLSACSRVPDEPNPVVKEMRPMPGKTSVEMAPPAPLTTTLPQPAAQCPADPNPGEIATLYGHGDLSFITPDGKDHKFKVEIAATEEAQTRGLMYRTSLAEDAGMIFVFKDPHPATFWMHNTCIPLDMVFVSEDKLVIGVVTAPPLNDTGRSVPGLSKYVVELAAGVAKKRGIAIGTKLVTPP
jgi:uncharacterized membrane protein (UPF0127 family)